MRDITALELARRIDTLISNEQRAELQAKLISASLKMLGPITAIGRPKATEAVNAARSKSAPIAQVVTSIKEALWFTWADSNLMNQAEETFKTAIREFAAANKIRGIGAPRNQGEMAMDLAAERGADFPSLGDAMAILRGERALCDQ